MSNDSVKSEIALRLTVRRPPPKVAFAVQRGRIELLPPSERSADGVVFDFPVRVELSAGRATPRWLGPYIQGPTSARFVYVNSGTSAAQGDSAWRRRAKVPLGGIPRSLVEQALHTPHARLEAAFDGVAKDGGPVCATVKDVTWRLVLSEPE